MVTIIKLSGVVVINYVIRNDGDQLCYQEWSSLLLSIIKLSGVVVMGEVDGKQTVTLIGNQSTYLSINSPIHQSIQSTYLPINSSTHNSIQSTQLSRNSSINWSVNQPINQPIHQSINQSIHQSIHPYISHWSVKASKKHLKYKIQNKKFKIHYDLCFRSSHHGQSHMGHTSHQSHNSSGGGGGGHGGGTHRSMAYQLVYYVVGNLKNCLLAGNLKIFLLIGNLKNGELVVNCQVVSGPLVGHLHLSETQKGH